MSEHRFLVFGATGYTGRFVVENACARGVSVVAHIRPGSPRAQTVGRTLTARGARLAEVPWAAEAISALVRAEAPTHVFCLLGITKAGARREGARTGTTPSYAQVDTGYTQLVVDACGTVEPLPRLVYLSSLGADTPRGNAYLGARHAVEQALAASSVPYTIVRPSFISGADRDEQRTGERLGSVVADVGLGLLGALGAKTTRDRYATVSGTDLGRMLVTVALADDRARTAVDMVDLRALDR